MTSPTPTANAAPMAAEALSNNDIDALILALQAENAAIYSYGLVTAYGTADRRRQVATDAEAHRARRDATMDLLTAGGAEAPVAAPGYTVPFPVTDPGSAAQLALLVEDDAATAWRSVLERADSDPVRALAVDNLADSAIRAGSWRIALGINPPTIPFPGQPA